MKIGIVLLILLAATASVVVAPAVAQTQPQILTELFCSFGCANCPGPDSAYNNFVTQNPSYGIVVINYHNQIADPADEFYKESRTDVDKRDGSSYYNVSADPAAFINGYLSFSTPNDWVTDTKTDHGFPLAPLTQAPKAAIGSDDLIHITFSATGPTSGSSVVRVALKESHIYFVNTEPDGYGNPPDSLWSDIFRAMLPNSTDATPLSLGETRSFDVVFDPSKFVYGGNWNPQNMDAVVFVQDVASNQGNGYNIESIGLVSLASANSVTPSSEASSTSIRVAGPPSNPELEVTLPASSRVNIVISDMLGRPVRRIAEAIMPAGQTSVDMNGSNLPAGCYIARLTVDGRDADQAKFIVAP
ncbi:MAG TPA: T9SS type A sorting domain-containing protein [Candidatus Kapabacteria bacterium]|nr:T9SS type A sorting domain-containing protein [Candidatus Kapabacteria bacterium]